MECWGLLVDTVPPINAGSTFNKKRKVVVFEMDDEPVYVMQHDKDECSRFQEYDALFVMILSNQQRLEAKLDAFLERAELVPAEGAEQYEAANARFAGNAAELDAKK